MSGLFGISFIKCTHFFGKLFKCHVIKSHLYGLTIPYRLGNIGLPWDADNKIKVTNMSFMLFAQCMLIIRIPSICMYELRSQSSVICLGTFGYNYCLVYLISLINLLCFDSLDIRLITFAGGDSLK